MAKWAQGTFTPKRPDKYIGTKKITYRSGWELSFCHFCDNNDNILQWASESIQIPYKHPLTGKQTIYVPDFLVVYKNKHNRVITELVEIKPKKQSLIESRASNADKLVVIVNHAKWTAASAWCKRQGIVFRVITEENLFHNGGR